MSTLIRDFFMYAYSPRTPNRRGQVLQFVMKDYPAYLWTKPSIWRVINFPLLLIAVILY